MGAMPPRRPIRALLRAAPTLVALVLCSGLLSARTEPPTRRALLVGIEAYDASHGWPKLRGPRLDVLSMREALLTQGFRAEDLHTLFDESATHAGILQRFDELIAQSAPGDVLLFYFAGHGSLLPDEDGDELDQLDETLIPFDATRPDGQPNDILDDELRAMIARANERTDHVVFIFDCCSSGTNVRGDGDAVQRFVDPSLRGLPGARGLAGVRPGQINSPGTKAASGYAEPGASYVALSACRSQESAYEVRLTNAEGESEYRGLFTTNLVEELRNGRALSYEALLQNTRDRITAKRKNQTPLAEGPLLRRALFSQSDLVQSFAFTIELPESGPLLRAGRTNGLEPGSVLAVYSNSARAASQAKPLTRIRLTDVGPVSASFAWLGDAPEGGDHGKLLALVEAAPRTGLGVAVVGAEDEAAAQALIRRLDESPHLHHESLKAAQVVVHYRPGARPSWVVENDRGTELGLSSGVLDQDELFELIRSLDLLGRSRLVASTVSSTNAGELDVVTAFERLDAGSQPVGPLEFGPAGLPALKPGERFGCRLENRSTVPIYATLLVFSPDGEIGIVQSPQNIDDSVPPGATLRSPALQLVLNLGSEPFYREGTENFRWVVTTGFHDLRNLCQPSVTRGATRGLSSAPPTEAVDELSEQGWLTVSAEIQLVVPD